MSRLISRILLAMFVLPLGAMLYVTLLVLIMEGHLFGSSRSSEATVFILVGLVVWLCLAVYWTLLWGSSVTWSGVRIARTAFLTIGSLLLAGVIGAILDSVVQTFGSFVGSVVAPLTWLVGTAFVWRETTEERRTRIRAANRQGISCPTCGYNLTGLTGTRCPECGSQFTLDELLAAQPAREMSDLEEH